MTTEMNYENVNHIQVFKARPIQGREGHVRIEIWEHGNPVGNLPDHVVELYAPRGQSEPPTLEGPS